MLCSFQSGSLVGMTRSGCDSWVGVKGDCRWGSTLLAASYVAQVVVLTKFSDSLIIIETKLRASLIIAIECMAWEKNCSPCPFPDSAPNLDKEDLEGIIPAHMPAYSQAHGTRCESLLMLCRGECGAGYWCWEFVSDYAIEGKRRDGLSSLSSTKTTHFNRYKRIKQCTFQMVTNN